MILLWNLCYFVRDNCKSTKAGAEYTGKMLTFQGVWKLFDQSEMCRANCLVKAYCVPSPLVGTFTEHQFGNVIHYECLIK